jgi:hypothetical protein
MRARRVAPVAAVLAIALAAPSPVPAAPRRTLLHVGDSLGVGTQWFLPAALPRWRIHAALAISRHAPEVPGIVARYGRGLPRVVVVSAGTNDDPRALGSFRTAIRRTMRAAGRRRCVVWANIVRPAVAGASYRGLNVVLAEEARRRRNLRVFQWARMARRHRGWFGPDGVHPSGVGYRVRARGVAAVVRRCD